MKLGVYIKLVFTIVLIAKQFCIKFFILIKECTEGWYGLDCKHQCPGHCRDNAECNNVTGLCDLGCAAGWRGTLCDKSIYTRKVSKISLGLIFFLDI